ncbi:hypothetical protein AB0H83_41155 [Dactylosporangium sp. NPDC050688]|uniref:hypothetical protein n=1 Tax=Dactylosporangium sp. NPDC050688 TaxID=3157217 RepID=UPI0033F0534B
MPRLVREGQLEFVTAGDRASAIGGLTCRFQCIRAVFTGGDHVGAFVVIVVAPRVTETIGASDAASRTLYLDPYAAVRGGLR